MNPVLIRLALLGSRNAWGRPAAIVAGVSIGTTMLLLLLGAMNALESRDVRQAWVLAEGPTIGDEGLPTLGPGSALVDRTTDYYRGETIIRLDVAALPGATITIPGIGAPPAPGTYFASPALAERIASAPAGQLGARFGTPAGIIAPEALASPDLLIAVVGVDPNALPAERTVQLISAFAATPPPDSLPYQIILAIGATGLFFPVIVLVGIATRLGAAERKERFATLRLIGASPRHVGLIAGLEMLLVSLVGGLIGVALAAVLRPLAARIPLNGGSFFPEDLAVGATATAGIVAAMVLAATVTTMVAIRRIGITPLGASRQLLERPPRARRVLVLAIGLTLFALPAIGSLFGFPGEVDVPVSPVVFFLVTLVGGFFLITLGIILIGPWLTYRLAGILSRLARSAAGVIAGSRMEATPAATFRSVSGLVIAVFMVSVFAGTAGAVLGSTTVDEAEGTLPRDGLMVTASGRSADAIAAAAASSPGVTDIVVAFHPEAFDYDLDGNILVAAAADATALGFTALPDAAFVAFDRTTFLTGQAANTVTAMLDSSRPRTLLAPASLIPGASADPAVVIVRTNGTPEAIEAARTAIILATDAFPRTRFEINELGQERVMRELAFIAYLGAFVSIGIAGCSLAIATASSMIDRKRVLGLMRLMGLPIAQLGRIVSLETALPLVSVLAVSIVLGLTVAWLILTTLSSDISFAVPEPAYFATLAVGLCLALAVVALTFSMIRRNTAIGATRFE